MVIQIDPVVSLILDLFIGSIHSIKPNKEPFQCLHLKIVRSNGVSLCNGRNGRSFLFLYLLSSLCFFYHWIGKKRRPVDRSNNKTPFTNIAFTVTFFPTPFSRMFDEILLPTVRRLHGTRHD